MKRELTNLTNDELLDRYLDAVKAQLPADKAGDIVAEMRSNLQSLIEDRELRPEELSAILKRQGHPAVVAARYGDRPGRGLIGPQLFPFYRSTLCGILGVWVIVRVIGAMGALFASQGAATAGQTLLDLGRDMMLWGFLIGAGVTAVFAVWEYLALPFPYADGWKPERLPAARTRPAGKSVGEAVRLFLLPIALFWPVMFWVWNRAGTFSPSPTVYAMRLPLLLLVLLWISQFRLNSTPMLRIAINTAGLMFALVLLSQGDLLLAGPHMTLPQSAALVALNRFFAGLLVLSCISSGVQCVRGFRDGDRQTAVPVS